MGLVALAEVPVYGTVPAILEVLHRFPNDEWRLDAGAGFDDLIQLFALAEGKAEPVAAE